MVDVQLHVTRMLIATFRIVLERLQDDGVHPRIRRAQLAGHLEAPHRQLAGEQLVEHDAHRIDVGAMVDLEWATHLFGSDVVQRTHRLIRPRQRRMAEAGGDQLGQSEVDDLHALWSSRMFSGLMSRWTTPSECAKSSAMHISPTMRNAFEALMSPSEITWRRFGPSTSSRIR